MTLPESTLEGLKQLHGDLGQAIVKLTESATQTKPPDHPQVEIVRMAHNTGLLVVGPSAYLRRIPFLHLMKFAPARFLLALDPGNDYGSLELALCDILEEVPKDEAEERRLILQLSEQITRLRQSSRVRMAEILFVDLHESR
jgi:hypothetical protein